jgi:hypothetical protein
MTASQSASPSWCQGPIWDPRPIFPILSLITFLDSFGFVDVGRPLWREIGSVVFSYCLASLAQSFSDVSPAGLMSFVYCLYFWDSPNLEGQVPVFIPPPPPRNRVAQLYPRALGLSSEFTHYCMIYLQFIYVQYIYQASFSPGSVQQIRPYQE